MQLQEWFYPIWHKYFAHFKKWKKYRRLSYHVRNETETIDEEMQADQPEYDNDDAEEDATEDEIDADEAAMFEEA